MASERRKRKMDRVKHREFLRTRRDARRRLNESKALKGLPLLSDEEEEEEESGSDSDMTDATMATDNNHNTSSSTTTLTASEVAAIRAETERQRQEEEALEAYYESERRRIANR